MRMIVRIALAATLTLTTVNADALAQARWGSIYDPTPGPQGLVANKTARRVGDLVTVVIEETQDLKNEEKSDLSKNTNLNYQLSSFNVKPNAFNVFPDIEATSADAFSATANYEKKGKFTARLTAVVIDRLPGGNLVINGRRELRIDQETKVIEFTGIVRRYDITQDNTVMSELVANAKVSYVGRGPLTRTTNRRGIGGFVHSVISWLWPF